MLDERIDALSLDISTLYLFRPDVDWNEGRHGRFILRNPQQRPDLVRQISPRLGDRAVRSSATIQERTRQDVWSWRERENLQRRTFNPPLFVHAATAAVALMLVYYCD